MTAARSVTATFAINTYALTITPQPTNGYITSNTGSISCGTGGTGVCSATYNYNTSVTLTPNPSTGYSFTGWGGSCSGTGSCVVSMTAARSVTATFSNQPPTVGQIIPTSATATVPTIFSVSVSDNIGVTSCNLYASGTNQGAMTFSPSPCGTSCTASRSYTPTTVGNCATYASCSDGITSVNGVSVNVNIVSPFSIPTVTTEIATINIQNNQAVLKGIITANGGASVDKIKFVWGTSPGSYTSDSGEINYPATFEYTLTGMSSGTVYYYKAQARNSAGWSDLGVTNERKAVIYLAEGAMQSFNISVINPVSVINLLSGSLDTGGTWHNKDIIRSIVDSDTGGPGLNLSACAYNTKDYSIWPPVVTSVGSRTCNRQRTITVGTTTGDMCPSQGENMCGLTVSSKDTSGNESSADDQSIEGNTGFAYYSIDWEEPIVGDIYPLSAEEGVSKVFYSEVSDNTDILGCSFIVDEVGYPVTPVDGVVSLNYRFNSTGTHSAYVYCVDHLDENNLYLNSGVSNTADIEVSARTSSLCDPGATQQCQSGDGMCVYTLTCTDEHAFPPCPSSCEIPTCSVEVCETYGSGCGFGSCGGYEIPIWDCIDGSYCGYSCQYSLACKESNPPNPSDCSENPPTIKIEPITKIGEPGDSLEYVITVTNENSGGIGDCLDTTFDLTAECVQGSGWSCDVDSLPDIEQQRSATTSLFVASPFVVIKNSYPFSITVTGATGSDTEGGTYVIKDQPPAAEIVCCKEGCSEEDGVACDNGSEDPSCEGGYRGEFCLKNVSTDPDSTDDYMQNDIASSVWDISGEEHSCPSPLCDWSWSGGTGSYSATLKVTDYSDVFNISETKNFNIKEDIVADFGCGSAPPEEDAEGNLIFDDSWEFPCGDKKLTVKQGDAVYFIDNDNSTPSDGADLDQWCWTFVKSHVEEPLPCGSVKFVSTTFPTTNSKGSGEVSLKVLDNAGRSDLVTSTVRIIIPVPGWQEGTP
jgi:hypothetical protein